MKVNDSVVTGVSPFIPGVCVCVCLWYVWIAYMEPKENVWEGREANVGLDVGCL